LLLPLFLLLSGTVLSPGCRSKIEERLATARTLIDEERYNEAIFELRECLAQSKGDARPPFLLGVVYARQGKLERAGTFFRQALEIDSLLTPSVVNEWVQRGTVFVARGQNDRAVAAFERALVLDPHVDLGDGFCVLGERYFGERRIEEAAGMFERAIGSGLDAEGELDARLRLAQCYEALDDLEAAFACLDEGSRTISDPELLWERGRVAYELSQQCLRGGYYERVRSLAGSVIKSGMPEVLVDDAYFAVGESYFLQGEYRDAIAAYEKVLRLNPIGSGSLVEDARRRIELARALDRGRSES